MLDLEKQKLHFANHVATFSDYGNIKILDFKNPDSNEYRIRFLFEEDYYRLHISGDLGELTACNYRNMCYDKFYNDFAKTDNWGYFWEKVEAHSRPLEVFDVDDAKEDLLKWFDENDVEFYDDDERSDIIDEVFYDYDESRGGISHRAYSKLEEYDPDAYTWAYDLGKRTTCMLQLYLLAFKLAYDQLNNK